MDKISWYLIDEQTTWKTHANYITNEIIISGVRYISYITQLKYYHDCSPLYGYKEDIIKL